ncbi:glycopeptide [Amylocystis lapponica]|nr:glycopeptide [Amylocystis lapponica]
MSLFKISPAVIVAIVSFLQVNAETHTVTLTNKCGYGTPLLIGQNGETLSTGGAYTQNGEMNGLIAYLQTGNCGANGDDCTLIEATLNQGYSSADISLISPHKFSVASGFSYYDGCDGAGANCANDGCPDAFYNPNDNQVQVGCPDDNVSLAITFCG